MSNEANIWDEEPTNTKQVLKEVGDACNRLKELKAKQAELELELKNLTGTIRQFEEVTVPDLLSSAGLEEIKLESGEKVKVKQVYTASIRPENWGEVKAFLVKNEEDAMIKLAVDTRFGTGRKEQEQSVRLLQFLADSDINFKSKETIHPMTLKSYVRQKIEAGEAFPADLFGVHVLNKTTIK